MIVYSAPLDALPFLPPDECLDVSARGARSVPPSAGAWLAPSAYIFEAWQSVLRRVTRMRLTGAARGRALADGWERFEAAYHAHLIQQIKTSNAHRFVLASRPRVYLLDDGDGITRPPGVAPCDPGRTPRRVLRGVLVGLGAEDGGEWQP